VREQGAREKEAEKARPPREDRQIQRLGVRREGRQLVTQQWEVQQGDPRRLYQLQEMQREDPQPESQGPAMRDERQAQQRETRREDPRAVSQEREIWRGDP
jgi:hypothetical protein